MKLAPNKRGYRRRPGMLAAAAALGVNYSHLYRVICTKERASAKLTARYRAWRRERSNRNPK